MPKAAAALQRCFWSDGSEIYDGYHDREWGRPVIDDVRLFTTRRNPGRAATRIGKIGIAPWISLPLRHTPAALKTSVPQHRLPAHASHPAPPPVTQAT